MRGLRNSLAFWFGVLVSLVALSWMFPARAAAQTTVDVEYWCIQASWGTGIAWTSSNCAVAHDAGGWRVGYPNIGAAKAAAESHMETNFTDGYCPFWANEWTPLSGGPQEYRNRQAYVWDQCTGMLTAQQQARVGPYTVQEEVPPCPAADTELKGRFLPGGSAGTACQANPTGPAGYGCEVSLSATRKYKDPSGNWFASYRVFSTGNGCTPGAGDAQWDEKENESNVTCTVMSGNVHCWEKDATDCQYVNGERWCFDDVDVADLVITEGGQILSTENGLVTDEVGDPAAPDSEIARAGPDGETPDLNVGHWNGGTVGGITTTGVAVPNPQQGGGVPGTGTGGTGDGDGDGDGEPFSGPELGEGEGYGDSLGGYWSAVSEGPWGSALDGIGEGASGGACPVAEFNWIDGTPMRVDFHCALLEDFEALIGLLFFFGWTWIAVRVLFSA